MCVCVAGGSERGTVHLAQLSPHVQSLHPFPVNDWWPSSCCPSGGSRSGWICEHSRTMGSFKLTFLRKQQFLLLPQCPLVFTARSYEASFFWCWNPGLRGLARISGSPGVPPGFYLLHMNVGPPTPLATTTATSLPHCVLSAGSMCLHWLPVSAPPTYLDEYFFKLVVGLSYSSIFWQFWLFFCFEVSCAPSWWLCVMWWSMSTYASILARSRYLF